MGQAKQYFFAESKEAPPFASRAAFLRACHGKWLDDKMEKFHLLSTWTHRHSPCVAISISIRNRDPYGEKLLLLEHGPVVEISTLPDFLISTKSMYMASYLLLQLSCPCT